VDNPIVKDIIPQNGVSADFSSTVAPLNSVVSPFSPVAAPLNPDVVALNSDGRAAIDARKISASLSGHL
jgi:hypothetical protein